MFYFRAFRLFRGWISPRYFTGATPLELFALRPHPQGRLALRSTLGFGNEIPLGFDCASWLLEKRQPRFYTSLNPEDDQILTGFLWRWKKRHCDRTTRRNWKGSDLNHERQLQNTSGHRITRMALLSYLLRG